MGYYPETKFYTVHREVREVTNDYGRAGEVEWRLVTPQGECIDVFTLRRDAIAARNACNAYAKAQAL
jgi:hypothetical protein